MAPSSDDPLIRYLLGRATEEERTLIEKRLFTEDGFEEELYAAADDIMDDYLAGRLVLPERAFFEKRFLALPRHRERLNFVRALRSALPDKRKPWQAWALVATAALAVAFGAGWLLVGTRAPSEPVDSTAAGPDATVVPLPRHVDAAVDVDLGPHTRHVRLEVDLNFRGPRVTAAILDASRHTTWTSGDRSVAEGVPFVLDVPAERFDVPYAFLQIESHAGRNRTIARAEYVLHVVRSR
jgi:hypothetical protein